MAHSAGLARSLRSLAVLRRLPAQPPQSRTQLFYQVVSSHRPNASHKKNPPQGRDFIWRTRRGSNSQPSDP